MCYPLLSGLLSPTIYVHSSMMDSDVHNNLSFTLDLDTIPVRFNALGVCASHRIDKVNGMVNSGVSLNCK